MSRPTPKRDLKQRILVLDAAEPAEGCTHYPWDQMARYLDRRRSYLLSMADMAVIRNRDLRREVTLKAAGRLICEPVTRPIQEAIVDTMAACGFGFA